VRKSFHAAFSGLLAPRAAPRRASDKYIAGRAATEYPSGLLVSLAHFAESDRPYRESCCISVALLSSQVHWAIATSSFLLPR
jgi:hypothetical protein